MFFFSSPGWTSDADPRKIEKEQDLIWQQIHSKTIKNQANVSIYNVGIVAHSFGSRLKN